MHYQQTGELPCAFFITPVSRLPEATVACNPSWALLLPLHVHDLVICCAPQLLALLRNILSNGHLKAPQGGGGGESTLVTPVLGNTGAGDMQQIVLFASIQSSTRLVLQGRFMPWLQGIGGGCPRAPRQGHPQACMHASRPGMRHKRIQPSPSRAAKDRYATSRPSETGAALWRPLRSPLGGRLPSWWGS